MKYQSYFLTYPKGPTVSVCLEILVRYHGHCALCAMACMSVTNQVERLGL
jgi:hypothetical protein